MCDTVVLRGPAGMVLAKNSDRDPNEAQLWTWAPAADHAPDDRVHATYVDLPQVARTHAVVLSRPWWMWGAEMGANEHGVAIGNEAVFTTEPTSLEPGLLGMDLLRLALERATSAREAVEVVVGLLEEHGQSGSCSRAHPRFSYHNSFLVTDREQAFALETASRRWAVEEVRGPARSISNGLTIPGFAEKHADRLRGTVARCSVRRSVTQAAASAAAGGDSVVRDAMALLRDNGTGGGPRWSPLTGSMVGPNMHAGGLVASSQTVASWVSDTATGTHWATGTADPALSLFVPLRIDDRLAEDGYPTEGVDDTDDGHSLWWRHERWRRTALRDWVAVEAAVAVERDALERRWLESPPATADALAEADRLRQDWRRRTTDVADRRPRWVRARWAGFDRAARRGRPATSPRAQESA